MAGAIVDWPKLFQQTFEHTKPGGFAEFQDFCFQYYSDDGSLKEEQALHKWMATLCQACVDFGRDPSPGLLLESGLKDAGFQNVTVKKYRVPVGPWAKDQHMVCSIINT